VLGFKQFFLISFVLLFRSILFPKSNSAVLSVSDYQKSLKSIESEGSVLDCPDRGKFKINDCKKYNLLKNRGCAPVSSTLGLKQDQWYNSNCDEIENLSKARAFKVNYFNLNSPDWWKFIPADVIPVSGGIYNDEIWAREKNKLIELVRGKLLGEIQYVGYEIINNSLTLILSKSTDECGEIFDTFYLSPIVLADFDNDSIAELLIKSFRFNESEKCWMGSGNRMGGQSFALLKKTGKIKDIVLLPFQFK